MTAFYFDIFFLHAYFPGLEIEHQHYCLLCKKDFSLSVSFSLPLQKRLMNFACSHMWSRLNHMSIGLILYFLTWESSCGVSVRVECLHCLSASRLCRHNKRRHRWKMYHSTNLEVGLGGYSCAMNRPDFFLMFMFCFYFWQIEEHTFFLSFTVSLYMLHTHFKTHTLTHTFTRSHANTNTHTY